MNPLEKQYADKLHEQRLRQEEQDRADLHRQFQEELKNPTLKLVRQLADLRQRVEQLELEAARQRHLQSRGEM